MADTRYDSSYGDTENTLDYFDFDYYYGCREKALEDVSSRNDYGIGESDDDVSSHAHEAATQFINSFEDGASARTVCNTLTIISIVHLADTEASCIPHHWFPVMTSLHKVKLRLLSVRF